MKAKTILKALAGKKSRPRSIGKKLVRTYVSLFLIFVLIFASSFAWFTEREAAQLRSGDLEFQSASSLRINKDQYSANEISIPAFTLDEVSSVDGRNLYFPLGESFNGITNEMYFREGNMGDRITDSANANNGHYVYKDFELKGTSGNTPVYIKSYKITVASDANGTITNDGVDGVYQDELKIVDSNGNPLSGSNVPDHQVLPPDHCAIRLAFIADSGVKPVVIDPSAQVEDYADYSDAVTLIDDNGVPELEQTSPDSFSTYYYEHTPLFVIPGGQKLNVTLVIWLEGTMGNSDAYIGKHISVDIDIESKFAEMDTITFVDGTTGDTDNNSHYWVSNDDPIIACSYEDPYSNETPKRWKTVIMRKTKDATTSNGCEWQCEIPKKSITNIAFYRMTRTNGPTQATIYNSWHTRSNVMSMFNTRINSWLDNGALQTTRQFFDSSTNTNDNSLVYTAIHGNGYSTTTVSSERLSPCVGYWDYTAGSGSSSTGGGGQQSGGGSSSSSTCNVTVIARVPNDLSGKEWVWNTDKLGFETESGNSYYFDSWSDRTAQKTFTMNVGDKIVKFVKTNNNGATNYSPFSGGTQTFTVPNKSTYTVTYEMNNSDKWNHN